MVKKLFEIDRPVGVDTDIDWDTFFDDPIHKGDLSTSPTSGTNIAPQSSVTAPTFKIGTKDATNAATANIHPTDAMRDMMGKINIPDDMINQEAETENPHHLLLPSNITPDNLPAVVSREIAMTDPHAINPTWHKVANLPGNMSRAILTLGKALFRAFTNTPTEDIVMIGNVGGQGPNSTREVRGVATWVRKHGRPVDVSTIDFDRTIPGYSAEVQDFVAAGIHFKLVKDQFGDYIYAWPEVDSVGNAQQIARPTSAKPHRSLMRR